MRSAKWPWLLLLAFALLFTYARRADACSCGQKPTVLEAYEESLNVVIARVVSVEKSEDGKGINGIRSARLVVEKSYKGSFKAGDDLVLMQGGGADCVWTFGEDDIDDQYLIYLPSMEKSPRAWIVFACGRSRSLQKAGDDLLYLDNMARVRGKTRISGTIFFEDTTDRGVQDIKIRITGAGKTYEAKTDANGVYEIYGLPPGRYFIEPEIPLGWKLDNYWLRYSPSADEVKEESVLKRIPITLKPKSHASLDIHFEIDNFIRGKILDLSGKPMRGVCINAILAEKDKDGGYHADCTNERGDFEIKELPRGSYILVINNDGKISSREPFKTFYYPNVFERERAAVITIAEGDRLEDLNITPPAMEEVITVEGVLLYSDGKPVADKEVRFKAEKARSNVEPDSYARTDTKGRFSIKILKGLRGRLFGNMYTYTREFKNCPEIERIIKRTGRDSTDIETPALPIQADNNLYNVELKFPFAGCEKVKEEDDNDDN